MLLLLSGAVSQRHGDGQSTPAPSWWDDDEDVLIMFMLLWAGEL